MKRPGILAPLMSAAVMVGSGGASATETKASAPTVLITGSNRGIGFEFARQYAQAGWKVIATTRDPAKATELAAVAKAHPNLVIERLDVGDLAQIEALAAKYKGQPIDVLLNNAGILGGTAEQSLAQLDQATFEEVLRVNTLGPLRMSQAFLENVAASEQKKIVSITSGLSSITNTTRFGNLYFYRISKTGLNMGMRTLQADVRKRDIKVGILAPGIVDTALLRASGWKGESLTPEASAAAVIRNIENLDNQDAKFILEDGSVLPW